MIEHLALVGPTASGKSSLALRYAFVHDDVEIVSMDSMQVYRGMDVGTAKATPEERDQVPHHLIDVCDPDEEWSVVRFQAERFHARALSFHASPQQLHGIEILDFPHALASVVVTPDRS